MSKIMLTFGIVLAALAVILGALLFTLSGSMQIYGIGFDSVAILLVGGSITVGLGGVIGTIERHLATDLPTELPNEAHNQTRYKSSSPVAKTPQKPNILVRSGGVKTNPSFLEKAVKSTTMAASNTTEATIAALEKAKAELSSALQMSPEPTPPVTKATETERRMAVETVTAPDFVEETPLYVVEERLIHNRPARILSDGTVEAETEEGWMRFENLEHLDEYLEAVTAQRRADS